MEINYETILEDVAQFCEDNNCPRHKDIKKSTWLAILAGEKEYKEIESCGNDYVPSQLTIDNHWILTSNLFQQLAEMRVLVRRVDKASYFKIKFD